MKKAFGKINKSGFSLIELTTAAAILALALIALLGVFLSCLGLNELAKNMTIATNGAQKEMERIFDLTFTQISAEDGRTFTLAGMPSGYSLGVIDVDNSNPELLAITITVCWKQKGTTVIGEDKNLNGVLDTAQGEDANGNSKLDSPVQIVTLISVQ